MFEFNFNEEEASVDTVSTGKVLDTGIYDVEIITVSKQVASTGTIGIDWQIQVEGAKFPNMIYGLWVEKANGDKLFGMDILNSIVGIAGAKKLTEYQKEVEIKDGTKTVTAFKELDGIKCKVAIVKTLDFYNGEEREKNEIKKFFYTTGHTYAEKKKNQDTKQLDYLKKNLKDSSTSAWKKAKVDGELNAKDDSQDEVGEEESTGSIL